jgi:hypothetical protein
MKVQNNNATNQDGVVCIWDILGSNTGQVPDSADGKCDSSQSTQCIFVQYQYILGTGLLSLTHDATSVLMTHHL